MTNEDEICDMVIMCATARKEGKIIQGFDAHKNVWIDTLRELNCIVAAIVCDGYTFRIKPEPRTVRVRMYWSIVGGEMCGLCLAPSTHIDSTITCFHSWAGDEQLLTVPEALLL